MSEQTDALTQKDKYIIWRTEKRGDRSGKQYAYYLERTGTLLKELDVHTEYKDNFFDYKDYETFKGIYQQITGESDEVIEKILEDDGSNVLFPERFNELNGAWRRKYNQSGGLGTFLRSYLKFLDQDKRPGFDYPNKRKRIDDKIEVDGDISTYIQEKVDSEKTAYSTKDFLSEVFIEEKELNRLKSVLKNKKNLILKGAPGVGKTFIANRLAYIIMGEEDDSRLLMVQFHQSYSYEDFIEGYRPKAEGDGFELKEGPFVKFAREAAKDPDRDYFFIIDEINRGNMSKIFGELMMLIEADKRDMQLHLLYSNKKFYVPKNLFIIGMMNTADRSLALLDYALRRRFAFIEVEPAFENATFRALIKKSNTSKSLLPVIEEIKQLNTVIAKELGTGFRVGHSYFVDVYTDERVQEVVEYELIPQFYEYWFDDEEKASDWATRLRACCDGN